MLFKYIMMKSMNKQKRRKEINTYLIISFIKLKYEKYAVEAEICYIKQAV